MLTSSNIKMTFSFARVSKIAIATLKFVNKEGAKKQGNRVLELKKLLSRFTDWKRTFMLLCGSVLLTLCANVFSNS